MTQVPAGTYTVRIDNEFYRPSINTGVVVPSGGFVIVDATLSVWPDLETITAPSTGAAVNIVDLDTSYKTIVVGNDITLSDIDVILNITHSYVGDLDVWVENPDGDRAQLLLHNVANNGADITNCRFDDEACASIATAPAPYTGRWSPAAGACADAESGSSQGQWRLVVYDNFDVDEGTIDNWTLIASHFTVLAADDARPALPGSFRFDGNFPNPFNNSTEFRFTLERTMNVALALFNSTGQEVATVFDHEMNAGEHSAYFDASGLTSGLYFARMNAGGITQTHKMVLLK
jgi:subtilisin-like proprotein convertase family protein